MICRTNKKAYELIGGTIQTGEKYLVQLQYKKCINLYPNTTVTNISI